MRKWPLLHLLQQPMSYWVVLGISLHNLCIASRIWYFLTSFSTIVFASFFYMILPYRIRVKRQSRENIFLWISVSEKYFLTNKFRTGFKQTMVVSQLLVSLLSFTITQLFAPITNTSLPLMSVTSLQRFEYRILNCWKRFQLVWCNYFPTRVRNAPFHHIVEKARSIASRLLGEMLHLQNLIYRRWADHGFHLKANKNVLGLQNFHQELRCLDSSLWMLTIHWERKYLLFRSPDVLFILIKLLTALF